MKRLVAGILAVILTLQSFAHVQIVYARDSGQNSTYGDFITQSNTLNEAFLYELNEDGTCTITKYTGEDTNIEIPSELDGYEVGAIGDKAFDSCSTIISVTVPETVISIGDGAFRRCTSLKSISIPDSVLELGENAFGECTSLERITIPKEVVAISSSLFDKCTSLADVILPDGLIEIGKHAFSECSSLKSIVLPDNIMNIDDRAFSGCSSLESVKIPKRVKILRESVFWESGLSEIEIPNGVKEIEFGFCYFTKIKHVYIPDSVTNVLDYAFGLDIESVSLPEDTKYHPTTSFVNYNGFLIEEKDMELRPAPVREEDNSPEKYEIIFHPSRSGATVSLPSKLVINGEQCGELPNAERENYTFKGWYTKAYGGTKITADKVMNFRADQRAYAHWEKDDEEGGKKYPLAKEHFAYCNLYQEKGSSGWGLVGVKFNEGALLKEATTYNEDIAKFSIQMSTMAYCDYEQVTGADSVEDVFEKLQFDRKNVSYYPDPKGREGVSPCWIANKTILLDGEPTDIFCVVIRGTFQEEWIDNFDSGFGETTHKGFLKAAKFVKSKLDAKLEEAQHRVKIIVTGHSRGAATANLVGKLLDDEVGKYEADKQDIYVYGFASPNVAIMDDDTQKKYNNLYSIVNPEDFVTKVLPSKWEYRRYGITYVLPSKTTDLAMKWVSVLAAERNYVNYTKYLEGVQELYHQYRSYDRDGYQPYPKGMEAVSDYIDEVTRSVQNNNSYYTKNLFADRFGFDEKNNNLSLQSLYTYTLAYFMVGGLEYKVVAGVSMAAAFFGCRWGSLGVKTVSYFFVNEAIGQIPILTPNFSCAHRAEYYLAAMEILDAKELQQPRRILKGIVNCPVDIEIKDSDEKIIGRVIDNTVDETIEDHVQMDIHGDSKTFCIPEGLSYSINFTGNNNGTMDYTLCEVDADTGELGRTYYQEVQIVKGESYIQLIDENRTPDAYELVSEATGDRISASDIYTLENLGQLKVDITVEGIGCADSLGNLTPGDYITISALTDSNNSFLGWYDENDKFISDSAEYSFSIHNNMKFKAKFTNVIVEASDIAFKNDSITIEKGSVGYNEAIILPENATNKYIRYQSSNDDIVEVDAFGLLRAKSEGIITLTASTIDGILKTTSTVYVTGDENTPDNENKEIKVTSIRISQDQAYIENGGAIQLTAEISPSNADNKTLVWTTSDSSVATVDNNGLVTAISAGQATITATSTDGSNISASCIVTVEKSPANTDDSKPNDRPGGSTGSTYPGGTTPGTTTPGTTVPPNQDQNTGNNSNNTDSTKPEPDNELTIKLLYYIVSFEPNGGTKLSRKTMTLLNDDNLGILPKVQRRNYSFSGWYTQKSGGQKIGESTILNASTTLYAHWSKVAKPAKAKVSALKSSKTGQIAVTLKKVTGIKGYEIHYSTNKKFTSSSTAKVISMSTKKTLKNLKKGKTYYIRVRAYKTDSTGKKVYGAYSSVKKIKVKI